MDMLFPIPTHSYELIVMIFFISDHLIFYLVPISR